MTRRERKLARTIKGKKKTKQQEKKCETGRRIENANEEERKTRKLEIQKRKIARNGRKEEGKERERESEKKGENRKAVK